MAKNPPGYIVRLARTLPSASVEGVGQHCYQYAARTPPTSVIFLKEMTSETKQPRPDVLIYPVAYRDLIFKAKSPSAFTTVLIALTKVYGELRMLVAVSKTLRKLGAVPIAVHAHSINYLAAAIFIKYKYKVPVFLNIGGTDLLRAKKILFYKYLMRKTDEIFLVSGTMLAELREWLRQDKGVYTGNGVDHSLFRYDASVKKRNDIVSVGNLRWQKDYRCLIRAFSRIADQLPDFRLRIFGEGPERATLQELIDSLSLTERVRLEGTRSQKSIVTALGSAKLFVISSRSEGFPKALIEAMATRLPVVATDAGDCKAILDSITDVCPPGDEGALASKMLDILTCQNKADSLAIACHEKSNEFSWELVCQRVGKVYNTFLPDAH